MDTSRFFLFSFCLCFAALLSASALCLEIRMEGDRTVVIDDNGTTLDTANLPPAKVREDETIQANDSGVSIGAVTSAGDNGKNIVRETHVDNVTIISNGKTTVYRKGKPGSATGEQRDTPAQGGKQ